MYFATVRTPSVRPVATRPTAVPQAIGKSKQQVADERQAMYELQQEILAERRAGRALEGYIARKEKLKQAKMAKKTGGNTKTAARMWATQQEILKERKSGKEIMTEVEKRRARFQR